MRSFYYAILAMLLSAPAFTQVGINTTDPSSTLDVQASNSASPASTDGILIPRVTAFPSTNPGANQDGMLIFLSNAIGVSDKGFYYWDNSLSRWMNLGAEEWKPGVNGSGDNYIYATRSKLAGTDMIITDDGRIGFGTDDPVERFEFRGPGDNDFQITSANTNPPNYILYNTGGTIDAPTALATNQEVGSLVVKTHDGAGIREVGGFRFYMDGTPAVGSTPSRFVISTTPTGSTAQRERIIVRQNGNVGFSEANPTATLHLRAGSATANSAPLKFTAGPLLSTPEAGTMEYDGTQFYFTAGSTRKVLLKGFSSTVTLDFPSIPNNSSSELTVTVPGATVGSSCNCGPNTSIESGIMWNCYVSATNTVTIRLLNSQNLAVNPTSKTWKVNVVE
tara:strand:+ start:3130 stop:4305 length:1176 start_codon:yes stop_codon:yes gene_type:complete